MHLSDLVAGQNALARRKECRGYLRRCRADQQFVNYAVFAGEFGMSSRGGYEMPRILGEIQEEDDADGAGLLSSLVVNKMTGMPSGGYFKHAREVLKRSIPQTPQGEYDFWVAELAKLGMTPPDWVKRP